MCYERSRTDVVEMLRQEQEVLADGGHVLGGREREARQLAAGLQRVLRVARHLLRERLELTRHRRREHVEPVPEQLAAQLPAQRLLLQRQTGAFVWKSYKIHG